MRHTGTVIHFIGRIRLSAHRAIAAQYAAVKLQHLFAACRLMQPIYILSDDRAQLSLLLKLRKLEMRGIGLYVIDNELFPVKSVILLGITGKERVTEYRFGRILPFLVIQAVNAAKIGYSTFRRYACAAEKHDIIALVYPFFKLHYFIVHNAHS